MATTYSTILGLALPTTGELDGTWGTTVNNYITNYLDDAVGGVQIISGSQTAVTLSKTTGSALVQVGSSGTGSAQYAAIKCSGTPASTLTITVSSGMRPYLIINTTSQSVSIVGSGPTTGVTVPTNTAAIVVWNGSDFVSIATNAAGGATTQVQYNNGGVLAGSANMTFSSNALTLTGTVKAQAAATQDAVVLQGRAGGTSSYTATLTPTTLSASRTLTLPNVTDTLATIGTAQTFTAAQTFRAASAVRSEAASTQDAVVLAGRAGGTSSYAVTLTPTTLTANQTLTLPDSTGTILTTGATVTVAQGGTGLTTLTANNVLLGNGTSALQAVAPSTSGNVLTSNGTTWTSAAPSARFTQGTSQASTSGTAITFTGIPSYVKRITVIMQGVSLTSTANYLVQLGTSSGVVTTGYDSSGFAFGAAISSTAGLIMSGGSAARLLTATITIVNVTGNTWVMSAVFAADTATAGGGVSAGNIALAATLDRVSVTNTATGTNSFDAGNINILYEG